MYVIYVYLFVLVIVYFKDVLSCGKYGEMVVEKWLVVEFVVNIVCVKCFVC